MVDNAIEKVVNVYRKIKHLESSTPSYEQKKTVMYFIVIYYPCLPSIVIFYTNIVDFLNSQNM